MLVSGIVLGGVSVPFFIMGGVTAAIDDKPEENAFVFVGFIGGGVMLATGIPLLIAGIVKRGAYNDWYEAQQQTGVLDHVRVQPLPGGAAVGNEASF